MSDGALTSGEALVTIHVNSLPVASDATYFMTEDDQFSLEGEFGLLSGASDADGDPLAAVLLEPPLNGVVVVAADGAFSYTPDPDFAGADIFTFAANDGIENSVPATFKISVSPVNDPPESADDAYEAAVDDSIVVEPQSGVLANDLDVEDDPLTASLQAVPSHGTLILTSHCLQKPFHLDTLLNLVGAACSTSPYHARNLRQSLDVEPSPYARSHPTQMELGGVP